MVYTPFKLQRNTTNDSWWISKKKEFHIKCAACLNHSDRLFFLLPHKPLLVFQFVIVKNGITTFVNYKIISEVYWNVEWFKVWISVDTGRNGRSILPDNIFNTKGHGVPHRVSRRGNRDWKDRWMLFPFCVPLRGTPCSSVFKKSKLPQISLLSTRILKFH